MTLPSPLSSPLGSCSDETFHQCSTKNILLLLFFYFFKITEKSNGITETELAGGEAILMRDSEKERSCVGKVLFFHSICPTYHLIASEM